MNFATFTFNFMEDTGPDELVLIDHLPVRPNVGSKEKIRGRLRIFGRHCSEHSIVITHDSGLQYNLAIVLCMSANVAAESFGMMFSCIKEEKYKPALDVSN